MKTKLLRVVIETPRGSTEKYDYDKNTGHYMLSKILPSGMVFPYDFGFVPKTKGEDGDPLDIIVLSEFKSFPGCMFDCRLLGAIKAEQGKFGKKKIRNDRYIAVPACSKNYKALNSIGDIDPSLITELEDFFVNYNKAEEKVFKVLGLLEADDAFEQIKISK